MAVKFIKYPDIETDALHGINIDQVVKKIEGMQEIKEPLVLRGNPPLGVCTICVGIKDIGWEKHSGWSGRWSRICFIRGSEKLFGCGLVSLCKWDLSDFSLQILKQTMRKCTCNFHYFSKSY